MKILFISALFIIGLFISPTGYTQSVIINEEDQDSIVSGIIAETGREYLTVKVDNNTFIRVETDDLDLDEKNLDSLLSVGSAIKVIGEFDDDVLEADEIILTPSQDEKGLSVYNEID